MHGEAADRMTLAKEAIYLERELCAESGGVQDQLAATFGGLNLIRMSSEGFDVLPVQITNAEGKATSSAVIAGYEYVLSHASEHNVRVVNLSLGSATGGTHAKDIELAEKIDEAYDAGIVTVAVLLLYD